MVPCLLAILAFSGQEDPKKVVDEFRAKLKATAEPVERASLIRAFGDLEPKDPAMIAPLISALGPASGDPFLYVPTAAAEALGNFRSMLAAVKALLAALGTYRKFPYLHRRLTLALGKVGHPAVFPYFDEALGGTDPALASLAIEAIGEMPPSLALEKLFSEYDRMEARKKNAKDAARAVYERCQPEIEKAAMRISAQNYPTFAEIRLWWSKHAAELKKQQDPAPHGTRRDLTPPLVVELLFTEGAGTSTANSGVAGALFPSATMTSSRPTWTRTTPPNAGPAALEWDRAPGPHAVDLGGPQGLDQLRNVKSFTITGWFLCTDGKEAPGSKLCGAGNRIVSWLNPSKLEGVELVLREDGSLQLGVNEWAESSPARSKAGSIHVYDPKEKDFGAEQFRTWCFFAVTYTAGSTRGEAKVYQGWRGGDVQLVAAPEYDRGAVGPLIATHLTIGNVAPSLRLQVPDRSFRGIIDDVRIFASPRDESAALSLHDLIRIQNR